MNIRYYFITPTLYPIFCLTVSLMLGIWAQSYTQYWILPACICFLIAIIGLIFYKKSIAAHPLYIAFYIVACCFGSFRYQKAVIDQQLFCNYTNGRSFNLDGKITDIHRTTNPHLRYSIKLKLLNLTPTDEHGQIYYGHEYLCLYVNSINNLRIADTIKIHDVLFKSPKNSEFMRFLLKEHVTTSVSIHTCTIDLIKRPVFSWSRLVSEYKNKLLHSFRKSMDRETFLAFSSIFLGDPLAKKREEVLKSQLKLWGLFHYIARAGLHLVIFVSIWMFIFGLLPFSWSIRQIFIILICSLYFILTWPSIPFNRAFFTLLLVRTCGLFRLKTYSVPALLLIAFITLAESPLALFALDFQLSFGVTFGLAWFNEIRNLRYRY